MVIVSRIMLVELGSRINAATYFKYVPFSTYLVYSGPLQLQQVAPRFYCQYSMHQNKLKKDYKSLKFYISLFYIFISELLFGNFIISGNPGISDNKIGRKKVFFFQNNLLAYLYDKALRSYIYLYISIC